MDDYFDEKNKGGDFLSPFLSSDPDELLIERNEHLCQNQLISSFKLRFQAQD